MADKENNLKWKDRLLSSSLPLEYEVGKILASKNYAIDFDYSYQRYDNKEEKEFSVDILASGFYPFKIESKIKLKVNLLIECKYRNPNVNWVFMNDLNIKFYSNYSSKGAMKVFDEFSQMHAMNRGKLNAINRKCLKGVEVNFQNGDVHDTGILHGRNQLIYAVPSLLKSNIQSSLHTFLEDDYPFIICPILVTTSDLRILNNNFSIDKLQKTNSIDSISKEVPYLKLFFENYPSFEEHCINVFKDIPSNNQTKRLEYFRKLRRNNGTFDFKKNYSDPDSLLDQLKNGISNEIFSEIIICSFKNFPLLLKEIHEEIKSVAQGLETIEKS
jgi:hypothetical protein